MIIVSNMIQTKNNLIEDFTSFSGMKPLLLLKRKDILQNYLKLQLGKRQLLRN